jgi:hypothetical protein
MSLHSPHRREESICDFPIRKPARGKRYHLTLTTSQRCRTSHRAHGHCVRTAFGSDTTCSGGSGGRSFVSSPFVQDHRSLSGGIGRSHPVAKGLVEARRGK